LADAQLLCKTSGSHPITKTEIDLLGRFPGATDLIRCFLVEIFTVSIRLQENRILGELREDPELDLIVICGD
jgi:hypothetical protein